MKLQKIISVSLITLLLLLLWTAITYAAPGVGPNQETAVFFSEAVNLPGWLGSILAILSVILPIAAFQWMRQE